MSLRGQAASLTSGGGVFFGGWKAQNLRPFSMSISHLRDLGGGVARVGGAHRDPLLEVGDHRVGELVLLGRHRLHVFRVLDRL